MRRRAMTVTMAAFFAAMMLFSDVEIFADQESITEVEVTTETQVTTTEQVHTTETKADNSKEKPGTNKRKETKKKEGKETKNSHKKVQSKKKRTETKKKIYKKEEIISQNSFTKDQKGQKEYLGSYFYFNQADAMWNHNNLSLHSSGCGPTAVAVCISNLTHQWVTPVDTASWAEKNGYYSASGSLHSAIPAIANHWGLECKGLYKNKIQIEKALKSGHMIVGLMGSGYFTKKGHFITLLGIDKSGKVEVADVGSRSRSQKKYELSFIIGNSKSADAGGPFWEIWSCKEDKKSKKKQNKTTDRVAKKQEIIQKFYADLQADLTEFEREIPMEELLLGVKDQTFQIHSSKINSHLRNLGKQLNDEKLVKISETYSFGMDGIPVYDEKTCFSVPTYLEGYCNY